MTNLKVNKPIFSDISPLIKYVNRLFKSKNTKMRLDRYDRWLIEKFTEAKVSLNTVIQNFNNVTDEKMIELYIYEIKAAEANMNYWINKARENPNLKSNYNITEYKHKSLI